MSTSETRKPYETDLTDAQWEVLKVLLLMTLVGRGRPRQLALREILNAILYVVRTGCQWRNLPHDFPKWQSVYYYFRKWAQDGTWQQINETLRREERKRQGRPAEPSAASIDSQSVKTTEAGGERGFDAGKHVSGRKRHIVVDTIGNLIEVAVTAADVQDRTGAQQLLVKLTAATISRLQKLWADGLYTGDTFANWLRDNLGVDLEIIKRSDQQTGFVVLPRRWVVERTFAWLGRFRRLSKEYERCTKSSEAMIYLASLHTMLKRFAPAH